MKRLDKEQARRKAAIVERLSAAADDYNETVSALNAMLSAHRACVEDAAAECNGALSEARDYAAEIALEAQDYAEARSESWQESAAGAAYVDWQATWSGYSPDEFTPDLPADVEPIDDELRAAFEDLPDAPEEE